MYKIFSPVLSCENRRKDKINRLLIPATEISRNFTITQLTVRTPPAKFHHARKPRFNVSWPTRCVSRFVRTSWLEKHARPGIAPRASVHGTLYRVYSRNNAKLLCEARNSTSREQCRRVEIPSSRAYMYKVIKK